MKRPYSLIVLLACISAVSAHASTLAAVGLDISEAGKTVEWVHSTLMDGSAYSWRVNIPRGRDYDGFVVGLRRPGSKWLTLDQRGRPSRDAASEALFSSLEADAAASGRSTSIQVKIKQQDEDTACYFSGWTALSFRYAAVAGAARPSFTRIAPDARLFSQALPDPSLLEEGRGLLVCVAMMKAGGSCEGLLIETEDEYFLGEKALFSKPAYAALPYAKKAAAFMGSLFTGDAEAFHAAVRSSFPGIAMRDADWRMFDGQSELKAMQKRLMTTFLNTMLSATDFGENGRTFRGLDSPTWFECLYGVNRVFYVAVYLRYLSDGGVPVWADSITENDPGYAWQDYEPVADGSALASAALALVGRASSPAGEQPTLHGLGLLTQALASTELRSRVEGLGGSPLSFMDEDMEMISILLSGFDTLRPGDLLFHYGSGSDEDEDPPQLAVVVRLPEGPPPAPGEDPLDFLGKLVAVTIRAGDPAVSAGPVLGKGEQGSLFPDSLSFHVRRLVATKGDASK
jgi:hypothetical protein